MSEIIPESILEVLPLGTPWPTMDPFLFCVFHVDAYPAGNETMGPNSSLDGRNVGRDFAGKDGWNMYHGHTVPGFPQHPHRGFETVTIVRRGYCDHSDSLGATARYGNGDVQWLTAGGGIQHAEMFPLFDLDNPNPFELIQIWLNLPAVDKMAPAHFTMLWREVIPRCQQLDAAGRKAEVTVIAGQFKETHAPNPPPHSWASRPEAEVAIWNIRLAPGAIWTLPRARDAKTTRMLYVFRGSSLHLAGRELPGPTSVRVRSHVDLELEAGLDECEILMLQGKPIGEPVVEQGPFVMNTHEEIQRAIHDYQLTQFGGWPWSSRAPVHPREETRFAKHADGRVERRER